VVESNHPHSIEDEARNGKSRGGRIRIRAPLKSRIPITADIGDPRETSTSFDKLSGTDIARLDMAHKIRHTNYNSIWEQQKHFTWLISIILSAQAIILASTKLDSFDKLTVLFVGSLLGMITSVVAFKVQRIEGGYFCHANEVYAEEYRAIYPHAEIPHRSQEPIKVF
jgi:hypothetical protein